MPWLGKPSERMQIVDPVFVIETPALAAGESHIIATKAVVIAIMYLVMMCPSEVLTLEKSSLCLFAAQRSQYNASESARNLMKV